MKIKLLLKRMLFFTKKRNIFNPIKIDNQHRNLLSFFGHYWRYSFYFKTRSNFDDISITTKKMIKLDTSQNKIYKIKCFKQ